MSARPSSINTARDREITRLKRLLAQFEAIPCHRRDDELADARAASVREMLAELEGKPTRV